MKEVLTLIKGGKLISINWVYDDYIDFGEYVSEDVTDIAPRLLFDSVELEEDVTLRDIFFLLNKHMDFFEVSLGNWVKELTNEALSGIGKPYSNEYNPENIEYLELGFRFQEDKWETMDIYSHGNLFPDFGGTGFELKETYEYHKIGSRIPWGLSFSPTTDLVNIPLKLKKDVPIYFIDYTADPRTPAKEVGPLHNISYSLGQILYAIVWELSWHGPPEKRDVISDELKGMVNEITKEDTPKLEIVSDED